MTTALILAATDSEHMTWPDVIYSLGFLLAGVLILWIVLR